MQSSAPCIRTPLDVALIDVPAARFRPSMDSFLGSLHGVLCALEDPREMDELWGLSAMGFRTQVHRTLEPVGLFQPAWDKTLPAILRRLGYDALTGLRDYFYTGRDLRDLQFAWMDTIEKALEDSRPAIAFGLHGPAFGIVHGLDNDAEEYQVSTFLDGQNDAPINVQELGSKEPPLVFVMIPTGPVAPYDVHSAQREALLSALDHHLGRETDENGQLRRDPPDLVSGPAAYNAWSAAIETGAVHPHWGVNYHAAYYAEARSGAAHWLRRISGGEEWKDRAQAFQKSAVHLENEVECFKKLPPLFPLDKPEALQQPERRTEASACLRAARAEHIAAMEGLAEVFDERKK